MAPCSESLDELPASLCAQAFAVDSGVLWDGFVPKYSPALITICAPDRFFGDTSPWVFLLVVSDNRELLSSNGSITESRLLFAGGSPEILSFFESRNSVLVRIIGSLIRVAPSLPKSYLAKGAI